MAVAFDAKGAGSSGGASPISWLHTCSASATYLVVCIAVDIGSGDGALTATCTYNSVSVPSVLRWESGGVTEAVGFAQMFALASPGTGSALTVQVSVSGGSPDQIAGNSMSFTGATSLGTAAHGDSNATAVSSGSVTVPSTTSGNLIAGTVANGSGGLTFTSGTSEWVNLGSASSGGAAVSNGAFISSTGSSVALTFSQNLDFYAAIAVELQGGPVITSGPPLGSRDLGQRPAMVVTNAGWRGAQHSR